jgi:hypothetical protein
MPSSTTTNQLTELQRLGVWFIAVGAFLVAASFLWTGAATGLSGRPVGPVGRSADRLAYSVGLAGALMVACGSMVAAAATFPKVWVALLTVAGATVAVWLFAAWRLRTDSRKCRDSVCKGVTGNSPLDEGRRWDSHRYQMQMDFRWCLKHPFISDAKAEKHAVNTLGDRP